MVAISSLTKTLVVMAVVCVIGAIAGGENFDPRKVRLVDYSSTTGNFLLRGNDPKDSNNTFIYDTLTSTISDVVAAEGLTLPDSFYMVDISLENFTEEKDIDLEKNWFQQYPSKGEFIEETIIGSLIDPLKVDPALRKEMAKTLETWSLDKLPKRIPDINKMLNTAASLPLVIYFHCEAGADRTGQVGGSYQMTYHGWNFTTSLLWDNSVARRPIYAASLHGMRWYCLYLQETTGSPTDCLAPAPTGLY